MLFDTTAMHQYSCVERDETKHAPASSFGSSNSYHTVFSSGSGSLSSDQLTLKLEEEAGSKQPLRQSSEVQVIHVDESITSRVSDIVRNTNDHPCIPQPINHGSEDHTAQPCLEHTEVEELLSPSREMGAGEEGEEGEGFAIKCLPNGRQTHFSPSIASISFDLTSSSSPFSRPLTLISLASEEEFRRLEAVLPIPTAQSQDCGNGDESSTESSTSTCRINPSSKSTSPERSPSFTTASSKPNNALPSSVCSRRDQTRNVVLVEEEVGTREWGANFWCVVSEPGVPENTFFANPQTGECRWVLPKGTIVLLPSGDGEWWELVDEATGQEYYYHTRTKESRWTRPQGEDGMVIPMKAVQMSRHMLKRNRRHFPAGYTSEESRESNQVASIGGIGLSTESVERMEWLKGDPSAIVTTPLRPRTKSLNKTHAVREWPTSSPTGEHFARSHNGLVVSNKTKQMLVEQDLTRRARRSILLHDQRALSLARQLSIPPDGLVGIQQQRIPKKGRARSSTTGAMTNDRTFCLDHLSPSPSFPFLPYPSFNSLERGLGLDVEIGRSTSIRRVGKGLAFVSKRDTPHRVKPRRSLPFLLQTSEKISKQTDPRTNTLRSNLVRPHLNDSPSQKDAKTSETDRIRHTVPLLEHARKFANLITSFARCRSTTTSSPNSSSSFGNL